jgi:hypothetical protein
MTEPVIQCPHCLREIKLTESLAARLDEATRQEFATKLAAKDNEIARREALVREQEQHVAAARQQVDEEIQAGIRRERETIAQEEERKARLRISDELEGKARELAELESILQSKDERLAEAQKTHADLLRKQRELDDAKREFELTIERRVQEELGGVRDKAKRDAEDDLKLRLAEREETIAAMQRQIESLRQRAEQGSQQLQGEVQELELEVLLTAKFPIDIIEPVGKGEFGGCSACSAPELSSAGRFSGNQSARETGMMPGSANSEVTRGLPEPTSGSWLHALPKGVEFLSRIRTLMEAIPISKIAILCSILYLVESGVDRR